MKRAVALIACIALCGCQPPRRDPSREAAEAVQGLFRGIELELHPDTIWRNISQSGLDNVQIPYEYRANK